MDIFHDLSWVLPLRSPALTQLAWSLSWLGYATFIMFFMALGYWVWSKTIFTRLLLLVAVNALVNAFVKDLFQDPRPPLEMRLDDLVGASYGLPSGHAQLAVVLWLWLAWEIRRPWAWLVGSSIAFSVIFSRLYLGVHDVEDVLIGALLGGLSLLAFAWLRPRLALPPVPQQLALIVGVTGVALLAWPQGASAPEYVPLVAAWLAALAWGQPLEARLVGMAPPNAWPRRLGVVVLGTACFLAQQKLLKAVGLHWPADLVSWSMVKGLTNGLFVSIFMPWLFCKARLADSHPTMAPSPKPLPA